MNRLLEPAEGFPGGLAPPQTVQDVRQGGARAPGKVSAGSKNLSSKKDT